VNPLEKAVTYFEKIYNRLYDQALKETQQRLAKDSLWTPNELAKPMKEIYNQAIVECFNDLDMRLRKLEEKIG
jgi:hypothetical protein